MATGRVEFILWEYGLNAKASASRVFIPVLTATNFDTQIGLITTWQNAVKAVSIGNDGALKITASDDGASRNPSVNPLAQRENKWLVTCVEAATGNPVTYTIPCADLSLLGADGENMDPASVEYADLVTATLALIRSNDGNVCANVESVKFRARTI